jgi:predicted ABC-type ATPase
LHFRALPPHKAGVALFVGTNGAGKSSIVAEAMAFHGLSYFNPDTFAARMIERGMTPDEANPVAWKMGYDALRHAINQNQNFAFETTLGGESITAELHRAMGLKREVHIFYVGLATVALHVKRVKARVSRGGHAIPEAKIEERFGRSLIHLVGLIGKVSSLSVFDNSEESGDGTPRVRLVFRMNGRRIVEPDRQTLVVETPEWAKPLVAAAFRAYRKKE